MLEGLAFSEGGPAGIVGGCFQGAVTLHSVVSGSAGPDDNPLKPIPYRTNTPEVSGPYNQIKFRRPNGQFGSPDEFEWKPGIDPFEP